jgi:hypothetical protein
MLTFIMPLKSPAVCRDWSYVSRLTERSLKSVCRQAEGPFQLLLVCHRRPETDFTHPSLTIIEEEFAVPGPTAQERMADKSVKIWRGLVAARGNTPGHIMFVDADDCVSRRLAGFAANHPEANGWVFNDGYVHDQGSHWVLRKRDFHLLCGTSHILRCRPEDLPSSVAEKESDYWIACHGHPEMAAWLQSQGRPLAPLPFPGAIYNTATSESDSGMALRNWHSRRILLYKMLNYRPLTGTIREEYGLYPVNPP